MTVGWRPPTPHEFYDQDIEFPSEGMMFVGDGGIIMSSQFLVREPYLLSGNAKEAVDVPPALGATKQPGIRRFIDGVKSGKQIQGSFREVWPITEAVNLYAVSLRSGKTLKYDASKLRISNHEDANQYLDRDYRKGWSLKVILSLKIDMKISRRKFINNAGTAVGSAALFSQLPFGMIDCTSSNSKPKDFGFQVWTIREKLVANFPGTLKEMVGMGYSQVEMCSPQGYSNSGFEPLNRMSGTEMKTIIEDAGLKCISSHFSMRELRDSLYNRIDWAIQLGMKQMVAASFWLLENSSIDDYRRSADELNYIGEKTKVAGIQMVFHNHHREFEKRGDELIYDALLNEFDPDLVKMQFQVAVVNIGYKAADYFRNYPERFISAHLSDWSDEKEAQVAIGRGVVDWDDFFEAAKTGGVKNYLVEMAPETFAPSAEFLKG